MFTLTICSILNAIHKLFSKILLILQTYHTTCVSFSCEFTCKCNATSYRTMTRICDDGIYCNIPVLSKPAFMSNIASDTKVNVVV